MKMDYDAQLKLQAYLDGELTDAQARDVAQWIARDQDAVALFNELRNTRQGMVSVEVGVTLPESREFFWSKIEREIARQEQPQPLRQPVSLFGPWSKWLVPAGAFAVLAVAAFVGLFGGSHPSAPEMAVADPGAFTYQ